MVERLDAFEAMREDADAIVCDMVYPECGMCPILERCLKKFEGAKKKRVE